MSKGLTDNHPSKLIDTLTPRKLVKTPTCFKTTRRTLLDMLLTNKPSSFQKPAVCETGLRGCHKLVFLNFRSSFIRLLLKIIKYRNYKGFNENIFCHELDQTLLKDEKYKLEDRYPKFTELFPKILH